MIYVGRHHGRTLAFHLVNEALVLAGERVSVFGRVKCKTCQSPCTETFSCTVESGVVTFHVEIECARSLGGSISIHSVSDGFCKKIRPKAKCPIRKRSAPTYRELTEL